MTTAELITAALNALEPTPGYPKPNQRQLHEAEVRAKVATAQALNNIATALAEIARNTAL